MLSTDLVAILAPFAQLANKRAISPVNRCVQVTPDCLRGWASYGMLEAAVALGTEETFALMADVFYAVAKSLPSDEEVKLSVVKNVLHWSCGAADGKLALLADAISAPTIDRPKKRGRAWNVPEDFLNALRLGGLSCPDQSLKSLGIYGITLDNRNGLLIASTDDITISSCDVGETVKVFPEITTLSNEAVAMLASILDAAPEGAALEIDENDVYCVAGTFRLLIKPIKPLKQDIRALRDNFASNEVIAVLPHDRIAAFIKRAGAMAESAKHTYVQLEVAEGCLKFAFSEGLATTDEYHLVEGLEGADLPPIKLDAARMARVLMHTDRLILDHLDKGVLILDGEKLPFSYMIAGRKEGHS